MKPTSTPSNLPLPHGGDGLKPLILSGAERTSEIERAKRLQSLQISSREMGDLMMLGIGGYTPLDGFMSSADWRAVCDSIQLANGLFWPVPITLSVDQSSASSIKAGQSIALTSPKTKQIVATMKITEKYRIDKAHECQAVFQTQSAEHPGVLAVTKQGEFNLAGPVKVLSNGGYPEQYGDFYRTPQQTRDYFESKKWRTVVAFQTRNPMHRAHEYLVKIALETNDGVFIHSLLGGLKAGDIPATVRVDAIAALIDNYFVADTVLQSGYPLDMRYAGPREALLHGLFRQNYGCTHLIIGRDHAGVGGFYGPFAAQAIFDQIPAGALQIQPLKIDWTFWCSKCGGMASTKTCPHEPADRLLLSGTKLRDLLNQNQPVPENFSRPEVLEILKKYYASLRS